LTNADAARITQLYDQLDDYNKQPVVYKPVKKIPTKGRFGARKREGHTSQTLMKRCFLAGSSPALSPSRHRIVEVICIHLCKSITNHTSSRSDGSNRYDSRWKLIVQEYNYIRGRLFNSNLTESTELTLINISQTALRIWHKNQTRQEEILTLMQGKSPPGKRSVAKNLPAPTTPTCLQGEASLIEFQVPEDRTGEAVIKFGQTRARRAIDSKNSPSADINDPEVVCPVLPDTPQHKQSLDIDIHIPSSPSTPPSCPATPLSHPSTPPSHLVTPTTKVLSSGAVSNSISSVAHTPVVVNPTEPKKTRKRKIPPTKKQTQLFPQPTPYYFPPRTPYQPIPHFQPIFNPLYQPFTQQQPLTQQQLFMYTPYPSYPFMPAPTSQTPAPKKEKKKYTCRKCGKNEGHGQYKGYKYCPNQSTWCARLPNLA